MEDKLRIILSAEGERILKKLNSYASPGGVTNTVLTCWWSGEMRWGRNRISMATERRDVSLEIFRQIGRGEGSVTTNQLDDESLKCSLQAAERAARYMESRQRDFPVPRTEVPQQSIPTPKIWSDATANIGAEQRTELARILTNDSEDAGLMAAGYLEISLAARLMILSNRELHKSDPMWPRDYRYDCWSGGGCSMTVRHPKGVGSGWAARMAAGDCVAGKL